MKNSKRCFLKICAGFSESKFRGRKIFFKHLSESEQVILDDFESSYLERIIKLGAPTREERLKEILKSGEWTEEQERNLEKSKWAYSKFCSTKPKVLSVKSIDSHFEERELMLNDIVVASIPRSQLIGDCAEDLAGAATNLEEISLSSFADRGFTIPFFDDLDDLDSREINEIQNLYSREVSSMQGGGMKTIKRIVVQEFFSHRFWIAADPANFLMLPLWNLSHLQTYLLSYGKRFTEVLKYCSGAPEHFYEEPEKLEFYAIMIQDGKSGDNKSSEVDDISSINKAFGR